MSMTIAVPEGVVVVGADVSVVVVVVSITDNTKYKTYIGYTSNQVSIALNSIAT